MAIYKAIYNPRYHVHKHFKLRQTLRWHSALINVDYAKIAKRWSISAGLFSCPWISFA